MYELFIELTSFKLYAHMVVVSHTFNHGLLIFVVYLEKGKVLLRLKVFEMCVYMWAYNIRTEIYSKLNLEKKLICNELHKF